MSIQNTARNKEAWARLSLANQETLKSAATTGPDALVRAVFTIKGIHVEANPTIPYDTLYKAMQMIAAIQPEWNSNKRYFHTFAEQFSEIEALVEHAQQLNPSAQRGR